MKLTLTKNFYTYLRTFLLQTQTEITANTTSAATLGNHLLAVGTLVDKTGESVDRFGFGSASDRYYSFFPLNCWSSGAKNNLYTSFAIGNSNTLATEDDYCLSGDYELGTDYSASWKATSNPTITTEGKARLSFNMSFTAINDITIGELGLFKSFGSTGASTESYKYYLFGRATLDTPIELKAGESATFQIDIEI